MCQGTGTRNVEDAEPAENRQRAPCEAREAHQAAVRGEFGFFVWLAVLLKIKHPLGSHIWFLGR